MNQKLPNMLETTIQKIREMVDVNSVIGDAITTPDGTTIIPVSKVSVGFGGGVLALVLIWLVLKKTKIFQRLEGVIAWTGILLATALVAFFMLFPTCVFIVKLLMLLL